MDRIWIERGRNVYGMGRRGDGMGCRFDDGQDGGSALDDACEEDQAKVDAKDA